MDLGFSLGTLIAVAITPGILTIVASALYLRARHTKPAAALLIGAVGGPALQLAQVVLSRLPLPGIADASFLVEDAVAVLNFAFALTFGIALLLVVRAEVGSRSVPTSGLESKASDSDVPGALA